jgi:hypothetical protein
LRKRDQTKGVTTQGNKQQEALQEFSMVQLMTQMIAKRLKNNIVEGILSSNQLEKDKK